MTMRNRIRMLALLAMAAPLHASELTDALWRDDTAKIQRLLDQGASLTDTDYEGCPPLALAVRRADIAIAQQMIAKGADVNATCGNGNTPLHEAASHGRLEHVELLLSSGARVDTRGYRKSTAITTAARYSYDKYPAIVVLLKLAGADEKIKDEDGKSAYKIAKEDHREQLLDIFAHPDNHRDLLWKLHGQAKFDRGDYAGAVEDYSKAIAIRPLHEYLLKRARAQLALAHFPEARADGERMIALEPGRADGYLIRAQTHVQAGEFAKARADLTTAMNCETLFIARIGNINQSRALVAKERYELLYTMEQAEHPDAYAALLKMIEKYQAGDTPGRLDAITDAIRHNPEFADYYNLRGVFEQQAGQLDAAVADFRKAIALDPLIGQSFANLGRAYLQRGDSAAAEEQFALAQRVDPGNASATASQKTIDDAQWADMQSRAAAYNEQTRLMREREAAEDERQRQRVAEEEREAAKHREPAFHLPVNTNGPCGFTSSCYYDGHYYIGGQKVQTSEERDNTR